MISVISVITCSGKRNSVNVVATDTEAIASSNKDADAGKSGAEAQVPDLPVGRYNPRRAWRPAGMRS